MAVEIANNLDTFENSLKSIIYLIKILISNIYLVFLYKIFKILY